MINGTATTTGSLIAGGNTVTFGRNWILTGGGTFTSGNSTTTFATTTPSLFSYVDTDSNVTLTFGSLSVSSTHSIRFGYNQGSGVLYSVLGNLTVNRGDAIFYGGNDLTVASTTLIRANAGVYDAHSASFFTFNGTSTVDGILLVGNSGGLTFNGDVSNTSPDFGASGNNRNPTITFARGFVNTGTFVSGSSTTIFSSTVNQTIPSGITFWNLTASSTATITMAGNATASKAFMNRSGSTLAVGANRLAVLGTYSNAGTISETTASGGTIIHAAESVLVTDSSGSEVSSISTAGSLYVTVQDNDQNLLSDTVETISVTLTTNSAAGSDSETITLTETGVATGIFRNTSGVLVVNSSFVSTGNGQIEISASGAGTGIYTDAQDSADSGSDTVTLTYVAASSGSSSGSGGGGVGSSGSGSLPPIQPQFQTSVQNLARLPVPIHTLVKLPDDGKASTQYDSAVYYTGADGKRHAFPNANVYFTWYKDFSGVQVISEDQLASITLGSNVTYKPGVKMVKFTTDPKVYAVAKGGILRWIKTEAAAVTLYGSLWNKNIDDISDAFYANYSFGQDVTGLSDFDPVKAQVSVAYPSDSLQK